MKTIITLLIIAALIYGMIHLSKSSKSSPSALDNPPPVNTDDDTEPNP
jgi:hypothetical protein